jgi:hypothetical protein
VGEALPCLNYMEWPPQVQTFNLHRVLRVVQLMQVRLRSVTTVCLDILVILFLASLSEVHAAFLYSPHPLIAQDIIIIIPTPICPWARRSFYSLFTKETIPYRPDENPRLPSEAPYS